MRAVLWAIIVTLVVTVPATAATGGLQAGGVSSESYAATTANSQMRAITSKSTIQRLSFGQAAAFIGGGVLGAFLIGRIVARMLALERAPLAIMGMLFGATLGGQWCDKDLWPC